MKHALIVLGVAAVVVLTLGAFNRELVLDVDYAFGVWRSVNAFWLFAIAAALIVAAGFGAAVVAQARAWRLRGKLEKELLEVYRRLRAVEAEAEQARTDLAALSAGRAGVAGGVTQAELQPDEAGDTAVTPTVIDEPTVAGDSPVARPSTAEPPGAAPPDTERTMAAGSPPETATEVSWSSGSDAEAVTEVAPVGDGEAAAEEPTRADGRAEH